MSVDTAHVLNEIEKGVVKAIPSRKITQETCRKFDYRMKRGHDGGVDHLAIYRDEHGQPKWIKVRHTGTPEEPKKAFAIIGKAGDEFFGQHLWTSGQRDKLTIVGGEIDCLTFAQATDLQWPVVSPGKGELSLAKCVKANLPWLLGFKTICIGMDNDPAGQEATVEALKLLPPGKVKLIKWTRKDPNEMLLGGEGKQIFSCMWNAEAHRPDGIVDARSLTARCLEPPAWGLPWAHRYKTDWTFGRRRKELYGLGSGIGMGKSDYQTQQVAADLLGITEDGERYEPQSWGIFSLEGGGPEEPKMRIAAKIAHKIFAEPPEVGGYDPEDIARTLEQMDTTIWDSGGRLFINDSQGITGWPEIVDRITYLAKGEGVDHFLVDPLTALITDAANERQELDHMVLSFVKLMESLDTYGYYACHLTRPSNGPPHEEGGQTSLRQFRGSNGIGMFSSFVFGYEGNQQAEDEMERTNRVERLLKARKNGKAVGRTATLYYDPLTGMLDTANLGAMNE